MFLLLYLHVFSTFSFFLSLPLYFSFLFFSSFPFWFQWRLAGCWWFVVCLDQPDSPVWKWRDRLRHTHAHSHTDAHTHAHTRTHTHVLTHAPTDRRRKKRNRLLAHLRLTVGPLTTRRASLVTGQSRESVRRNTSEEDNDDVTDRWRNREKKLYGECAGLVAAALVLLIWWQHHCSSIQRNNVYGDWSQNLTKLVFFFFCCQSV